ncbi:MAG TPA: alpha/beta fold hydrolase [Burkholderiales bacterium]
MSEPRIRYQVDGAQGPWVTFVTGIANDTTLWDAQVPALAHEFRVLRYDLRGHGGSEATPPPYTIELLVGDLLRLWDELGIEKSHLVGLGLGGAIAQAAAISHGARLISLMPCCCRAQMVPDFAILWHGLLAKVRAGGVASIVEQTVQRWFGDEFKAAHPEVLDGVRRMIERTSRDGYLGCVDAFLGLALEDELHRISVPTHYVSGADDRLGGPPALMERLSRRVARARHSSVPKAAHIANIQNPGGFNLVMCEFLKEHS